MATSEKNIIINKKVIMFFIEKNSPDRHDCCGCSACEQICKHNALQMKPDKEGFLYPILNREVCIDCNLCETVCPMIHGCEEKTGVIGAYAAINKDKYLLKKSSSGGVFSIIAAYILDLEGIVYGASFDESFCLNHIGIERMEDLGKLRGSKYLQSDNQNVYSEIKMHLLKGRWVYYVGTGCQVAGLKRYLRKDFSTLVTSDLICHGTPSQKAFYVFMSELERKYSAKVVAYSFRDKTVNGWSCSSSSSLRSNNKIKYIGFDPIMKAYFNAFISGAMNRESCYKCPFATVERTGDITLADYWGINKYHDVRNRREGVSAILVNTGRGENMISLIREKVELIETRLEWIADENHNLTRVR